MVMDPPDTAALHVSLLHKVSSLVSSTRTLDEILHELVNLAAQVTGSDACLIYLVDRENDEIVLSASQLPHSSEVGSLRLHVGEGVTGWVAEHNSVVSLPSRASQDSRFKGFPSLVEDTFEAFLSVPLVSAGEVIGVINVHHREARQHTAEEIALMTFVAEQLAGVIARRRLEEENQRLQQETQEMKRQLETRKIVERAKGLLQQKRGLSEEDAYLHLRNESRRQRRPMRALAEEIIAQETGRANGA
ncbi:MAG: GAF domain-containing protein [Bryobacteraceae bacterium]